MPTPLKVAGVTFQYPNPGEDPDWSVGATGWAAAVTNVLNNLNGEGDILERSSALADNQTSAADIAGMAFDNTVVTTADVHYAITRNGVIEKGRIEFWYDGAAWQLTREFSGINNGILITVTSGGQAQYTSTSTGNAATIRFETDATLTV